MMIFSRHVEKVLFDKGQITSLPYIFGDGLGRG
ncbi:hypothetical protein SAMN05428964_10524 [Thalassospira xiamenensis]|uniref:Uncharacterized protein n=1 Tax=Thalassospira xiamenensis TaxID=220697 RepID=A0A285TRL8_9PROT|nr:hypothetical protein SAMN05428964_10524 [Thalassospira xiamenensis]